MWIWSASLTGPFFIIAKDTGENAKMHKSTALAVVTAYAFLTVLVLAAVLFGCTPVVNTRPTPPATDLVEQQMLLRAVSSTVTIHARPKIDGVTYPGVSGSGTVVWAEKDLALILTCQHVVFNDDLGRHYEEIEAETLTGKRAPGIVQNYNEDHDLALLLTFGALDAPAMPLAKKEPPLYSHVFVIGSPSGHPGTVAPGLLTLKSYPSDLVKNLLLWQITSLIYSGSSGGTVIDEGGSLIGVPQSASITAQPCGSFVMIPQIGFAVPLHTIREFLSDVPVLK